MSEESKTPRADEPDDLAGAIGGFIDRKKARIAELETELSAANARIAELEEFKRELDEKFATTTDEQLRAELEAVGCDFTAPPAERPTPITDADERNYPQPEYLQLIQFEGCPMGVIDPDGYAELYEKSRDLERQLAEVREQRDTAMRRANKIAAEALALTEQRGALAEALEKTAKDFITFRNIARENGIVGTIGLESLELAAAALAAINPDTPS